MADHDAATGIFAQCSFAFVPSKDLTASLIAELSAVVQRNGAEVVEPKRNGSIDIGKVTHVIANSIDFPQYSEAHSMMLPIVDAHWITASIVKNKACALRPFSPDPRMIFSKVTVTCAGLPVTDKESICGAVMALGGQESKDVTRTTTHLCALTMDDPVVAAAMRKGSKAKVVLPHWFDDCFKLGKKIDEGPYLLPNPSVLNSFSASEVVNFPTSQYLEGATSAMPDYLPVPPDAGERQPLTVFERKAVMLSTDLGITQRLRYIITGLITNGGGRIVTDVDKCDMFVCQYRDGLQYVRAAKSDKEVGSLSWLYHLITNNEWTSPTRRLLHYPLPRDPLPGFEKFRITVSNYGGEARTYLENLIKATGATFTKTMKADNTHLITARNNSEKCEAAADWGIAMVNHLWLEESYARCETLPVSVRKYIHFPPRTNLGEIIGQTMLDEEKVREAYYPFSEEEAQTIESAGMNTRPALAVSDGNVPKAKRPDAAKADKLKKAEAKSSFATPVRTRRGVAGKEKENDTPSALSTGGRSAKSKALSNLHKIAPDIELYEKEKKRASKDGRGPWGGKRAADEIDKEKAKKVEKAGKAEEEEEDEEEDEDERPTKKARTSLPNVEMRVMLTGFQRWLTDTTKEARERKKLRDLGIQLVQEGQPCDYLAAPVLKRTVKFIRTLARGPTIITSAFLEAALDTGKVPDPEDFILQDPENETKLGIDLAQSVARARSYRGKLLAGIPIYCTATAPSGCESFRAIAEDNGAIFKVYRARGSSTIRPTTAEEDGGAPPEPVYLLTGSSREEQQLWPRFRAMAVAGHMEPRVVATDWLLDVAMKQEVAFDDKFLAENFYSTKLQGSTSS